MLKHLSKRFVAIMSRLATPAGMPLGFSALVERGAYDASVLKDLGFNADAIEKLKGAVI